MSIAGLSSGDDQRHQPTPRDIRSRYGWRVVKRGFVGLALVAALAACGGSDGKANAMDACLNMRIVDGSLLGGIADNTATVVEARRSAREAAQADDMYATLNRLLMEFPAVVVGGGEREVSLAMRAIIGECVDLGYPWGG